MSSVLEKMHTYLSSIYASEIKIIDTNYETKSLVSYINHTLYALLQMRYICLAIIHKKNTSKLKRNADHQNMHTTKN